jgi:hypothetical protein
MKTKLSLDKKAIQGFFIRHVEKLVLIAIVAAFLGLAYGAATRPSYEHQPQELAEAAQRADENIEQIKQPVAPDWAKVSPYPEIAERSRNVVSETAYGWRRPVDPLIWPEVPLRTEPPLFAAEELRGTAAVGAIQMKAGSGQRTEGQRWIVLTALVPAAKQVQAFAETFKDLKRPESDTPKYIHFWVERAEMFGDSRDANPNWAQINVQAAKQIQNNWTTVAQEVVAAPFIHDPLVFPLAPLANSSWNDSVAHPPKIPLASVASDETPAVAPVVRPAGAPPDVPPSDMPPGGAAKPAADMPAAAPAAEGAPTPVAAAAPGGGAPAAPAPGAEAAADGDAETHGHTADVSAVEYLLLRFFDFTVEPGKRYAYRVKLLLANPNYKVEARYLSAPALAEKTYIESDWSEPCAPVFVPRDDRLLAGPVKAPIRITAEPLATVTLVKWMMDRGVETSQEFKISRGQLANLSSEATDLVENESGEASLVEETTPSKAKKREPAGPMITFKTDALLLDVRGGTKWSGQQVFEPGELLLVDYDGRLVVHSEIDDLALIPKPKKIEETEIVPEADKEKDKGKKEKKTGSSLFGDDFGGEKKGKSGRKK